MTRYLVTINIIQLLCVLVCGGKRIPNTENGNKTFVGAYTDKDLPETDLMLLDRVILRKYSRAENLARRNRNSKQNSTTTTTTATETSDSGRPCVCANGICKCCTGYVMDLFNQKACMKITYHPGDFAFDVAMSMNDRILYENSMSGKNPKPICISPPRLTNLKVCAKFYNVFFPGRNFHFCLAMTGQWRNIQLFDMAFNCLRMGANGIVMVRPEDAGGISIPNPQGGVDAVIDAGDDEIEEYDENVVRSLFSIFDDDDDDDDYDDDDDKK